MMNSILPFMNASVGCLFLLPCYSQLYVGHAAWSGCYAVQRQLHQLRIETRQRCDFS